MLGRVVRYSDVINTLYRRLAKLQFMVWQVVLHCAAASGTGTAGEPPSSGAESGCTREAVWKPHSGREAVCQLALGANWLA